ncbi:P27 family phage terminase small subunit [Flavobacterium algicola]|uniref:P27 family phage terminase small subunit n=1 Tax=Flavobacterium algicola TaxID=556529 RepID=UPI001EFC3D22|nr:P27 family phage terminase small subunit [Flavobacterium algicola]MCG9792501.1 P27 family phage terminase small subunit [Flavobacterium algicola]
MANLKIVTGDGEVKEVNKNLYQILDKLPAPSSKFELNDDQKYWYKYFGQQLVDTKKLTKPDLIHLHQLATSVDYYIQAEKKIREKGFDGGLIQTFKGGATNVSGYVTIREKMIKEINELSKHFGFSFKDRSKLVEQKQQVNPQGDLFEEFIKANHG